MRFCVGQALTETMAQAVISLPRRLGSGHHRQRQRPGEGAEEAETDRVDLSGWPPVCGPSPGARYPHPGAQLTFTDVDGHRYQVFLTDLVDGDIAYLEGIYRGRDVPSATSETSKTPGWPTCPPPISPSIKPG